MPDFILQKASFQQQSPLNYVHFHFCLPNLEVLYWDFAVYPQFVDKISPYLLYSSDTDEELHSKLCHIFYSGILNDIENVADLKANY